MIIFKYWVGGKKKNNGFFSVFKNGRIFIGSNHVPMTGIERMRFLNRHRNKRKSV